MRAVGGAPRAEGAAVTPEALSNLTNDIAEAAAKCVGGEAGTFVLPAGEAPHGVRGATVSAHADKWTVWSENFGAGDRDAVNSAAVLALRDRVVAQREERARMLAADDEALRVIDETARVYDAATVMEAAGATGDRAVILRMWLDGEGPWSRERVASALTMVQEHDSAATLDACDAILRRRAGTP